MALLDHPSPTQAPTQPRAALAQGELFARLMLQPLPLYKHGPEDEPAPTKH